MQSADTSPKATMSARVFRIAWDRKPKLIPPGIWLWLGKKRIPYVGRWEDLGQIASTEDGSLLINKK